MPIHPKPSCLSPSLSALCGRVVTYFGEPGILHQVRPQLKGMVNAFEREFGVKPSYAILGGRVYSQLMREMGGRPVVIYGMEVIFVKHDELEVSDERPIETVTQ